MTWTGGNGWTEWPAGKQEGYIRKTKKSPSNSIRQPTAGGSWLLLIGGSSGCFINGPGVQVVGFHETETEPDGDQVHDHPGKKNTVEDPARHPPNQAQILGIRRDVTAFVPKIK